MKNSFWLLLILLVLISQCLPIVTCAQAQPSADSMQIQARSVSDTLEAIHRLFLRKRGSAKAVAWTGIGIVAVGGLVALGSYAVINSAKKSTSGKPLEEGAASVSLKYSLPGLAIATLGMIRRIRFGRQRESVVTLTYRQGKGLPRSVLRSIRSQDFASQ